MGDSLYTSFWQSVLPNLIKQFSAGRHTAQLEVKQLSNFGDRQSYHTNFRITNGQLDKPNSAYAQGRDLHQVLIANEYFKENLCNSTIQVTISKDFILKMEILEASGPDFFTEEDFKQLAKFSKQTKEASNEEHQQVYDYLKGTYAKTAYWAKEVQKKIFPVGHVQLIQKPTNQANKFEYYHWAKIYSDKASLDYEILAYSVGVDTDNQFTIKVDTVGLAPSDPRRQEYLKLRGDFNNSSLVKNLPYQQVLDKGWKYLIDLTANIINTLKPAYVKLLKSFQGGQQAMLPKEPRKHLDMSLNTIFYGPPGTGKTYKLQSLCNDFTITKAVQTREEFLEALIPELTWWETIAAALMDRKASSVPELEKHEFLKIKAKQSGTKHVKQILWGSLQGHTDPKYPNVQTANRTEPYIFEKLKDSLWKVHAEEVEKNSPEILNFLNQVKDFKAEQRVDIKNYQMVTFHQNFSYEDFVEGIKPVFSYFETVDLKYEIQKGVFYQCCVEASKLAGYDSLHDCIADTTENRAKKIKAAPPFALFIDEVNRANVSSVLGELITLIEDDKRLGSGNEITNIILPYSKSLFGVPANLYIIGTMNTADRSVETLDTALRRRFSFAEMQPEPEILSSYRLLQRLWMKHWLAEPDSKEWKQWEIEEQKFIEFSGMIYDKTKYIDLANKYEKEGKEAEWMAVNAEELFNGIVSFKDGLNLAELLSNINSRLKVLVSRDHTIGHAWLMNVFSLEDLRVAFRNKVIPLLQEFFYNDYAKIGLVLGKQFIEPRPVRTDLFAKFKGSEEVGADYTDKIIYELKDVAEIDLQGFKSI
jgi:hypothetical protein